MKSLTAKIIVSVISILIALGAVFGALIATGIIEFPSSDDSARETSYVQKEKKKAKKEKKTENKEEEEEEKKENPADVLEKIEGRWGVYKEQHAMFTVITKNDDGKYSFTTGLMWTDYFETGTVEKIEKTETGKYQLTVKFPTVDNEMTYIEGHTNTVTVDTNMLFSQKLIIDDIAYEKIEQKNIEDYFKQFVNF